MKTNNMSEAVISDQPNVYDADAGSNERAFLQELERQQAAFVEDLVQAGCVSAEYAQSGALDKFDVNPRTGKITLMHLFKGDMFGGIHHYRTYLELNIAGREVAAKIHDDQSETTLHQFRGIQTERPNGTYNLFHIRIQDVHPITGQPVERLKVTGSTMFPDAWSAEDVLRAIVEVSQTTPTQSDTERMTHKHVGLVDGVKIQVITDAITGKIIAAFPTLRQPKGKNS
jgi:hypothetical protein